MTKILTNKKTIIITGSSDGIGLRLSKNLIKEDWNVIGIGNNRRYVRISDEEIRKHAAKRAEKKLKNKNKKKYD